jgi:hypothetical protein
VRPTFIGLRARHCSCRLVVQCPLLVGRANTCRCMEMITVSVHSVTVPGSGTCLRLCLPYPSSTGCVFSKCGSNWLPSVCMQISALSNLVHHSGSYSWKWLSDLCRPHDSGGQENLLHNVSFKSMMQPVRLVLWSRVGRVATLARLLAPCCLPHGPIGGSSHAVTPPTPTPHCSSHLSPTCGLPLCLQ